MTASLRGERRSGKPRRRSWRERTGKAMADLPTHVTVCGVRCERVVVDHGPPTRLGDYVVHCPLGILRVGDLRGQWAGTAAMWDRHGRIRIQTARCYTTPAAAARALTRALEAWGLAGRVKP